MAEQKYKVHIQNHGGWMNVTASTKGLERELMAIAGVRRVNIDQQFPNEYDVWVDPRYDSKEVQSDVFRVCQDAYDADLERQCGDLLARIDAMIAEVKFQQALNQWEYEIKRAELLAELPPSWQYQIILGSM